MSGNGFEFLRRSDVEDSCFQRTSIKSYKFAYLTLLVLKLDSSIATVRVVYFFRLKRILVFQDITDHLLLCDVRISGIQSYV